MLTFPPIPHLVGDTRMVRLQNLLRESHGKQILIKLEADNRSGSVKDRPANYILEDARRRGLLQPGGTIVEASSGNLGRSLAQYAAAEGFKAVIVCDSNTEEDKIRELLLYGAEVKIIVESEDVASHAVKWRDWDVEVLTKSLCSDTLQIARNKVAKQLADKYGYFRVNQLCNPLNAEAHETKTAPEIWNQCGPELDAIILPAGSCGQLSGISRWFKRFASHVTLIAVDFQGSAIFGGFPGRSEIPGPGGSFTPPILDDLTRIDSVYRITDDEAFFACRALCRVEGMLFGGSGAACVLAALAESLQRRRTSRIVVVAPDSGAAYGKKIFTRTTCGADKPSREDLARRLIEAAKNLRRFSDAASCANYCPDKL